MEVYGVEVEWIKFVEYKYKSLNENYMFLEFCKRDTPDRKLLISALEETTLK